MGSTRRGPGARAVLSALMLVAFCLALWKSAGPHTDDGCPVELHCFVCQWALGATAEPVVPAAPIAVIEMAGRVLPAETPALADAPCPDLATRGPPPLPLV